MKLNWNFLGVGGGDPSWGPGECGYFLELHISRFNLNS